MIRNALCKRVVDSSEALPETGWEEPLVVFEAFVADLNVQLVCVFFIRGREDCGRGYAACTWVPRALDRLLGKYSLWYILQG